MAAFQPSYVNPEHSCLPQKSPEWGLPAPQLVSPDRAALEAAELCVRIWLSVAETSQGRAAGWHLSRLLLSEVGNLQRSLLCPACVHARKVII